MDPVLTFRKRVPRDSAIADAKAQNVRGLDPRDASKAPTTASTEAFGASLSPRAKPPGTEFGVRGRRRVDDHASPTRANRPGANAPA